MTTTNDQAILSPVRAIAQAILDVNNAGGRAVSTIILMIESVEGENGKDKATNIAAASLGKITAKTAQNYISAASSYVKHVHAGMTEKAAHAAEKLTYPQIIEAVKTAKDKANEAKAKQAIRQGAGEAIATAMENGEEWTDIASESAKAVEAGEAEIERLEKELEAAQKAAKAAQAKVSKIKAALAMATLAYDAATFTHTAAVKAVEKDKTLAGEAAIATRASARAQQAKDDKEAKHEAREAAKAADKAAKDKAAQARDMNAQGAANGALRTSTQG